MGTKALRQSATADCAVLTSADVGTFAFSFHMMPAIIQTSIIYETYEPQRSSMNSKVAISIFDAHAKNASDIVRTGTSS